jgi:hypothetical protein
LTIGPWLDLAGAVSLITTTSPRLNAIVTIEATTIDDSGDDDGRGDAARPQTGGVICPRWGRSTWRPTPAGPSSDPPAPFVGGERNSSIRPSPRAHKNFGKNSAPNRYM